MESLIHVSYGVDILVVSIFIYLLLIFIKQTRSYFIFYGIIGLVILSALSNILDLGLTRKILDPIFTFFLVIFVIVFQREIRRFFRWLVLSRGHLEKRMAHLDDAIALYLTEALSVMAKKRIGAIIVLSGEYPLDDIIEGGFTLDGQISTALLLSIFDDSTPGHDGAILIENRRITKFGAHLPLAESFKGFDTMGTRHRAACGITEHTDALALVVSEERGTISVAQGGVLKTIPDKKHFEETVRAFMKTEHTAQESWWSVFVLSNFFLKIVSVALAFGLWFFIVFHANISNKDIVVPFEFQKIPEGLQVSKIEPSSITINVSGNNQDIQNLKVGDVRVVIDLKNKIAGSYVVTLQNTDIIHPSYIDIIKAVPSKVSVTLDTINPVLVPAN